MSKDHLATQIVYTNTQSLKWVAATLLYDELTIGYQCSSLRNGNQDDISYY